MVLHFTSADESSIHLPVTIISFIILFSGGFIAGGKGKQRGWLLGGLTGTIYSMIVFLYQFLGHDSLFTMEQIVYHLCYIITAMMGAILGVNIYSDKSFTTSA